MHVFTWVSPRPIDCFRHATAILPVLPCGGRSGHFELRMTAEKGFKVQKFRVHKEQMALAGQPSGTQISTFDRGVWDDLVRAFGHYENTGILK